MELAEVKTGAKVSYFGACYVIGKIVEDKVMIYVARRSVWSSNGLPDRVTVDPSEIKPWEPKSKVSAHAKTCQVCGRPIHAATGTIAHHGYERPGDGYQSPSCLGAKFLPFEVNRDRLGWYIEEVAKPNLAAKQADRAALDKPGVRVPGPDDLAELKEVEGSFGQKRMEWKYKTRWIGPDYDRRRWVWSFPWPPTAKNTIEERKLEDGGRDYRTYEDYLRIAIANADNQVKWAQQHVDEQQKRFDKWKPVKSK